MFSHVPAVKGQGGSHRQSTNKKGGPSGPPQILICLKAQLAALDDAGAGVGFDVLEFNGSS